MNIAQAKQIPISELVEHLGGKFSHATRSGEQWYFSPFRPDEKTASFKIDEKKNQWHDFGLVGNNPTGQGSGGDIINLWCDYNQHDRKDVKLALQWLEGFSGRVVAKNTKQATHGQDKGQQVTSKQVAAGERFKLFKKPGRIYYDSLKAELSRRAISQATALPFLNQAQIIDTQTEKKYSGFAFENSKNGWEISIPNPAKQTNFKTCIGKKAPTYLTNVASNTFLVFEGFFDFLTWQEMQRHQQLEEKIIILNSLSFLREAVRTITDQKQFVVKIIEFLDNDTAGEAARVQFYDMLNTANMEAVSGNKLYKDFDDLNAWWMHSPQIRSDWRQRQRTPEQKNYQENSPAREQKPKL